MLGCWILWLCLRQKFCYNKVLYQQSKVIFILLLIFYSGEINIIAIIFWNHFLGNIFSIKYIFWCLVVVYIFKNLFCFIFYKEHNICFLWWLLFSQNRFCFVFSQYLFKVFNLFIIMLCLYKRLFSMVTCNITILV